MRVVVFGLGYVGSITAAYAARQGHNVIGIDPDKEKCEAVNLGVPPVTETGLDEYYKRIAEEGGMLTAQTSPEHVIPDADISIICVGTPESTTNGCGFDLSQISRVAAQIKEYLPESRYDSHVTIIRSTIPMSTTRSLELPGFVMYIPEFLREGTALQDYLAPPHSIVGLRDMDAVQEYGRVDLPLPLLDAVKIVIWEEAELTKFCVNAFHAVKIAFSNEVGRLAKTCGVNGRSVMETIRRDNVLFNYLSSAMAYGGSCLPKDVFCLSKMATVMECTTPIIAGANVSNIAHQFHTTELIISKGEGMRVLLVGESFKDGSDDKRNSPMVGIQKQLERKGFPVTVITKHTKPDFVIAALKDAAVIFVGQREPDLTTRKEFLREDQILIDGVGLPHKLGDLPCQYEGICW